MSPNEASRFTYVQVADSLRLEMAEGRLGRGDRLPSIRALSEQYGIAPQTAQKALVSLREQGLITGASTRGYFVSDHAEVVQAAGGSGDEGASLAEQVRVLTERVDALERAIRP